jgi:hypothetical protein
MPNLYVTPEEIKISLAEGIQVTTDVYDDLLMDLCNDISRFIDEYCRRSFYPILATRYYDGQKSRDDLWIDHAIDITTVSMSDDDGSTYSDLAATDWIGTRAGYYNHPGSYNLLRMNENGNYSYWYNGQRAVKVLGIFAFHNDRGAAWELSGDTVQNDPSISSTETSLTVADVDGANLFGKTPRFQAGQLLKIEDEIVENVAVNKDGDNLTIIRGRNGSTAAAHDKDTAIYIYRSPSPVRRSAVIQATIQMQRGFQGFGDARAQPEIGQLFFIKKLDPQAQAMLDRGFKRNAI